MGTELAQSGEKGRFILSSPDPARQGPSPGRFRHLNIGKLVPIPRHYRRSIALCSCNKMRRSEPEKGISLSLKGGGRGEGISSDDEAQFPLPRFFPSSPETISLHFPQATSVSWLDFRSLLSLPYPKLGKPFIAQQKSHSVQRHGSFAKTEGTYIVQNTEPRVTLQQIVQA